MHLRSTAAMGYTPVRHLVLLVAVVVRTVHSQPRYKYSSISGNAAGETGDKIGTSVAIYQSYAVPNAIDRMAVGTPGIEDSTGDVLFFVRTDAGAWTPDGKVRGFDSAAGDLVGTSVAIDETYAIAGAPKHLSKGKVYLMTRDDGTGWTNTNAQQVVAPGGQNDDRFGDAVAMNSQGWVVIGAPKANMFNGRVYVCKRSGNSLGAVSELPNSNFGSSEGVGTSVAISATNTGDTEGFIAAGGPNGPTSMGKVHIFQLDNGGNWVHKQAISPTGAANDRFGTSVSIESEALRLVIGSPGEDTGGTDSGAVYVFKRSTGSYDTSTWSQAAKLKSDAPGHADGGNKHELGYSVALAGEWIFGGEPGFDGEAQDSGQVHAFYNSQTGGSDSWDHNYKIGPPSDHYFTDSLFGTAVAIRIAPGAGTVADETALIIGAPQYAVSGVKKGAAYTFVRDTAAPTKAPTKAPTQFIGGYTNAPTIYPTEPASMSAVFESTVTVTGDAATFDLEAFVKALAVALAVQPSQIVVLAAARRSVTVRYRVTTQTEAEAANLDANLSQIVAGRVIAGQTVITIDVRCVGNGCPVKVYPAPIQYCLKLA